MKSNWACIDDLVVNPYDAACMEFIIDENKFLSFKRDKRYTAVLEHVDPEFGQEYINQIKCLGIDIVSDIKKFKENDRLGNPYLIEYEEPFGLISPSTLRYIKNTYDIISFVAERKCKRIAEIGGGYGGLCKSLSTKVDFDEYVLFDLEGACKLSEKYLSHFPLRQKVKYNWNCENLGNFDLVINNYAYSELDSEIQEIYYNNVVKNSNLVYMILNKG